MSAKWNVIMSALVESRCQTPGTKLLLKLRFESRSVSRGSRILKCPIKLRYRASIAPSPQKLWRMVVTAKITNVSLIGLPEGLPGDRISFSRPRRRGNALNTRIWAPSPSMYTIVME